MAFELREGGGSLFKNDRKQKDTHPDYTGSIMVGGVEHWFSGWIKKGAKGSFLSVAVGDPKQKQPESYGGNKELPAQGGGAGPRGMDDEDIIPFAPLRELP